MVVSVRIADCFKSSTIAKQNAIRSRLRARYNTVAPKFRQLAANGLDREAEIIGNVRARHWQVNRVTRMTSIGDFDQKTSNSLRGGHAAEQHHAMLHSSKLMERSIVQITQ